MAEAEQNASLLARIKEIENGAVGGRKALNVLFAPGLADPAKESVERFTDSLRTLEGFLAASDSLIAYEQALDDLGKSLKKNGDVWSSSTEKGRENLAARNRLLDTALSRSQTLFDQGDKLGSQRILDRAIETCARSTATPRRSRPASSS